MKNLFILAVIVVALVGVQFMWGVGALVPFATAFALASTAVGVWLALQQYSLKLASQKVETDIELMTLFTKIMSIAHARGGYTVSEKVIEKLFESNTLTDTELKDSNTLNRRLAAASILSTPVGEAEQDAAIAAIAKLATRHDVLKEVAIQGLESIASFKKEVAEKYLKELK